MDFKSFQYFIAVAENGSISQAAKELGITQPSLSKYLKKLSDMLGLPFFYRHESGIVLNSAGECYVAEGKKILKIAAEMLNLFSSSSEQGKKAAIDVRNLYYISIIAQEQSILRAAEKLNIVQSALSQALTNLEKRAGFTLFNRNRYGLSLTAEGKRFVQIANKILNIQKELDNELRLITKGQGGLIKFGISHTFSDNILPQAFAHFHKEYPNTEIIVNTETSSVLKHMLLSSDLDLAIMVESGKREKLLDYKLLFYEQILLAISPENPIVLHAVNKDKDDYPFIDPKLLHHQKYILSENNMRLRQSAEAFFQAEGIKPTVVLTTANINAAQNLAARNVGIAFIPESHIKAEIHPPFPHYFSTSSTLSDWAISIVRRIKSKPIPLLEAFIESLKISV